MSVHKNSIEEARTFFKRSGTELTARLSRLGCRCLELDGHERLKILHDFYGAGEEDHFEFNLKDSRKKGHSFKDYICPDGMELHHDHFKIGSRFGRVIFVKDVGAYLKDTLVAELTGLNQNMMLSIDVLPVPMEEAIKEAENRLLGVATNITNWQRKQNANNNFGAIVPYDMEQQLKESKEFLDDLTMRDQQMMLAVVTLVHTADDKKQLDADTGTLQNIIQARHCQMGVLHFQQLDGLNTVLPAGRELIVTGNQFTRGQKSIIDRCVEHIYQPYRMRDYEG